MTKTSIYFIPGLAAGPEIFEHLELDSEKYTFHYLKWIKPIDLKEDVSNYANRMSHQITEENAVLVGVSFGGIMAQEMAKFVKPKKVIIISSVKNQGELPKKFKIAKFTKIYTFFPTKIVANFEEYAQYFVGKSLKKKAEIYQKYLSERNEKYLKWSIHNILKWNTIKPVENIIHIHGTKDRVFPIKYIKNAIEIKDGTHSIILTKAKKISEIIDDVLSC
ncbi:MAG: alpha/beta hydrolase [Polaribacter sp.]